MHFAPHIGIGHSLTDIGEGAVWNLPQKRTSKTVLPDRDHINLQAFGQQDPPRTVWDDYNTYRGPQPKGKAKSKTTTSVFTQSTDPPTPEEDSSKLDPHAITRWATQGEAST